MLAEARVLLSVVGANYGEYLCIWRTFAGNVPEEHMQVDKNQKVQIKDFFSIRCIGIGVRTLVLDLGKKKKCLHCFLGPRKGSIRKLDSQARNSDRNIDPQMVRKLDTSPE